MDEAVFREGEARGGETVSDGKSFSRRRTRISLAPRDIPPSMNKRLAIDVEGTRIFLYEALSQNRKDNSEKKKPIKDSQITRPNRF